MTNYTHIDPDRLAVCPVCHRNFEQNGKGRNAVYCSANCRKNAFRRAKHATKCTEADKNHLVQQHLFVGDWRFCASFPAWPRYRCVVCNQAVTGGAHYDHNDFDQVRGIYRRLICPKCYPNPKTPFATNGNLR